MSFILVFITVMKFLKRTQGLILLSIYMRGGNTQGDE